MVSASILTRFESDRKDVEQDKIHLENLKSQNKRCLDTCYCKGARDGICQRCKRMVQIMRLYEYNKLKCYKNKTYKIIREHQKCNTEYSVIDTSDTSNSGGRIRTSDLRVMGPTSYRTALPRDHLQ